jgi:outer membrane protein assembly factor BamA
MKSILTSFEWHYERERSYFTIGWNIALNAEIAGQPLVSDFSFHRYVVEATRYQPLGRYENLNLRLRAGSGTGDLPLQKGFELGGISTMPAFSYKEFSGNRLLLANAEYLLNGKLFDDVEMFPSWLLRNTNFILFYDAGYVNTISTDASAMNGYDNITIDNIKSDWGFGIGTRDAAMRLGFAWRTDVAEPVHVFLRLSRPF